MLAVATSKLEAQLPEIGAVALTLQAATVLGGMRRIVLAQRGRAFLEELDLPEGSPSAEAFLILATFTYPTCVAAVTEAEGLDIENLTLADFASLPEAFVDAWYDAVIAICPEWAPFAKERDAATEKKAATSGDESATG